MALDNASLHVNAEAPALAGEALEKLVQQYNAGIKLADRMSRRYPRALVHELIYTSRLTAEQCHDAAAVEAWTKQLVEQLNAKEVGASQYSYEVELHAELGLSLPKIIVRTHGVTHEHALSVDFLN
ncbi:DNA gyrase subunit B, partial [Vibrio alginolyticus]|nr:DNA gyrase subunit B [Vibrio alginolyticus]